MGPWVRPPRPASSGKTPHALPGSLQGAPAPRNCDTESAPEAVQLAPKDALAPPPPGSPASCSPTKDDPAATTAASAPALHRGGRKRASAAPDANRACAASDRTARA